MAAVPHRVVIVGGGFGGLRAARALRREPVAVTLVDRRNFHLFQPLLYQVATGGAVAREHRGPAAQHPEAAAQRSGLAGGGGRLRRGGPTGVELAGALGEIARDTLRHEFRAIDPARARIWLLEGGSRLLPSYAPPLPAKTVAALARLGVSVRTGALVTEIGDEAVTVSVDGRPETIPARTVLWAAGVQGSPLGRALREGAGASLDRLGRVVVAPDLTLPGRPEIVVIGDLAHCRAATGEPLPAVAQVALQQGRYAARLVAARLRGQAPPPFRYRDYGAMATIGRAAAVVQLRRLRLAGRLAWLLWLVVHLMALVQFQNRLLVLLQWAWNYFTHNRSARLITGNPR